MSPPTPEIWRAIVLVTIGLVVLSGGFVALVMLSQRNFVSIKREKLEALRERELRFRSLIENSFDVIMMADPTGKIIYTSPSSERVVGYSVEELEGRMLHEVFSDEILATIFDSSGRIFIRDEQSSSIEGRIRRRDGAWRWIEGTARNMLHHPGIDSIILNYQDTTERRAAEDEIRVSRNKLRELSEHLQSVREEDRTSIAREIHDELGQMLTVLKMDLALMERNVKKALPPSLSNESIAQMRDMAKMIDGIIQSVRRIATELRPQILDELGLRDAIEWEAEVFESRTGVRCALNLNGEEAELDQMRKTALFRICQEALTNVARHAMATSVEINLEKSSGMLVLEVSDDGKGMDIQSSGQARSLGILGMRERALAIGGELQLESRPDLGTKVIARIPLTKPSA